MIVETGFLLFGLEGAADRVEGLTAVMARALGRPPMTLHSHSPAHDAYRHHGLITPDLTQRERLWVRDEYEAGFPARDTLPALLHWLAFRHVELQAGTLGRIPPCPEQSFPACRTRPPEKADETPSADGERILP